MSNSDSPFSLPDLPYSTDALAPHISAETLSFHHGKHHRAYFDKLNELVRGTPQAEMSLEEIIRNSEGALFNNAAQAWNHSFYWQSLSPEGGGDPDGKIGAAITARWGSIAAFRDEFTAAALGQFGSGWAWLVQTDGGSLELMSTGNADNPLTEAGMNPLLTCDVWEHAYYIDYRNARAKYLEGWWALVNWDFANRNLR